MADTSRLDAAHTIHDAAVALGSECTSDCLFASPDEQIKQFTELRSRAWLLLSTLN